MSTIEEMHRTLRAEVMTRKQERISSGGFPYPSDELLFAEVVMEHLAAHGISGEAEVCHWTGRINDLDLRISGFATSDDRTMLDVFVTLYHGEDSPVRVSSTTCMNTANQALSFLLEAGSGNLENRTAPTHCISELVGWIRGNWSQLDRIRIMVLTDGTTETHAFTPQEVLGKVIRIEVTDPGQMLRQLQEGGRVEIWVDLCKVTEDPLPCVVVTEPSAQYDYALTALPGWLLKDLYMRYGPRVLEANVRTYLGDKKPVNRGIADTLRQEPEHFLAFNNGLVIVCDEARFARRADGSMGLAALKGLQIVNGGQTTSSIYFTAREYPDEVDLSRVMVPAKIVIPKTDDEEVRERLIGSVSRYANSQTAVKMSDLSANRPFHRQLEVLADTTLCPGGTSRWFYERAAGAYQLMLLRDARTSAEKAALQRRIPAKQRLGKTDVAKFHESWRGLPHQVAQGAEKNFRAFMEALDEDPSPVPTPLTESWYQNLIAKVILFRSLEAAIKGPSMRDVFRQGYGNVAAYTIAALSNHWGDRIDLEQIWREQAVSPGLLERLVEWAKVVNSAFIRVGEGRQFSEVAKNPDTWRIVRESKFPMESLRVPELPES
jgi:hypothetical protein